MLDLLQPTRLLTLALMTLSIGCEVTIRASTDDSLLASSGEPYTYAVSPPDETVSAPRRPKPIVPNATGAWPVAMPFRGVNLAGAEFGKVLPGVEGADYEWPTMQEVDYYLSKGMNTFRVGFKWERLQPTAYGELDLDYAAKLDALTRYATTRGAFVILNPHNFARYYGELVGSTAVPDAAFADLWRRLALRHAADPRVMFNLVNEPNTMPTEQWVGAANAAIAAIRDVSAPNTIIVPGNGWTGAHSWNEDYYGTPNTKAMLDIFDPWDRVLFEAHQYLDDTSGGMNGKCASATAGRERLAPFLQWLRENHKRGFIGEFAGGDNEMCNAAVADMLQAMMDASDVLDGWLWWAAGPAWTDNYPFSLDPIDGRDRPQMSLLTPHLFPVSSQ